MSHGIYSAKRSQRDGYAEFNRANVFLELHGAPYPEALARAQELFSDSESSTDTNAMRFCGQYENTEEVGIGDTT